MTEHSDVYFQYNLSGTLYPITGCQIVSFKFNEQEYKFECNVGFMYEFRFEQVVVYACKVDSDKLYPWLLQLIGLGSDLSLILDEVADDQEDQDEEEDEDFDEDLSSSVPTQSNYFFKLDEDGTWKNHMFTQSLEVQDESDESGGSIEPKQNEDNLEAYPSLKSKPSLNTYIESLQKSGASAATYYVYKESYSSLASEIDPKNLASYLGESDKKHTYVSVSASQDYEVSSFTKFSGGSVPKFEITLKGLKSELSELSESGEYILKSVRHVYESGSTQIGGISQLTSKEESTEDIGSESESSCQSSKTVQPSGSASVSAGGRDGGGTGQSEGGEKRSGGSGRSGGRSGSNGENGEQSGKISSTESAGSNGEKRETGESGSTSGSGTEEANTAQNSPKASQDSEQPSTGVSFSPAASKSSPNLPGIVCGAVFGSGGLIGGGILIYKCIG
ncbi:hypothetical protein BdWA1_002494 [Babesia duncani]|uniref:Uncharacterized protein n=1 Tax=Babesia duncani TaxID=323732 RepID=A0AAD9PHF8_9APIC|nr:hypothetical protein BdWA1_003786 [Babesia duncani]KAK2195896.1 hypothetical protein BdWA1_002494 [Babesia duncani]